VLDLRNDPGGLLDQAVRIAEHFVDEGKLIVYTEGREKESKMRFTSRNTGKEPHYPIVVLINSGSASASEIVAGALQDHKRAVIMGTQSFGKGSVQTIIPLSDNSGLRLTTARYYTPSGRSIQAKGITPDIAVEQKELAPQDKKDVMHIREKDLENHFESEEGKEPAVEKTKLPAYKSDEQIKGDYQILRALDLLKGWEILKSVINAS
jgi:carboxyl-terminal processing protease